jgi:hypothetical protein
MQSSWLASARVAIASSVTDLRCLSRAELEYEGSVRLEERDRAAEDVVLLGVRQSLHLVGQRLQPRCGEEKEGVKGRQAEEYVSVQSRAKRSAVTFVHSSVRFVLALRLPCALSVCRAICASLNRMTGCSIIFLPKVERRCAWIIDSSTSTRLKRIADTEVDHRWRSGAKRAERQSCACASASHASERSQNAYTLCARSRCMCGCFTDLMVEVDHDVLEALVLLADEVRNRH